MKNTLSHRARRFSARVALLLLLPMMGLAACDELTGSDDDDGIEGTWVLTEGSESVFLQITSSTVTVYDGEIDDCFYIETYNLTPQEGDQYTIAEPNSGFSFTVTIRRDGDNLIVGFENETEVYEPSDQDLSQLEECAVEAGGGGDPSITCSELPAISVGQAIDGELTTSDDMYEGRYFDLYGLTLSSETSVQIDATSDPVDTYLYLYEGDGTYITENDDASSETFNSRINTTLSAGCYRIEVTSWGDGETGAYTVSVN